ncbi:MAG: hypothetical protein H7333_10345 [Bdellovibrionales bacterium]|nr:hypothetical protein [Oligoflexia bacterium]
MRILFSFTLLLVSTSAAYASPATGFLCTLADVHTGASSVMGIRFSEYAGIPGRGGQYGTQEVTFEDQVFSITKASVSGTGDLTVSKYLLSDGRTVTKSALKDSKLNALGFNKVSVGKNKKQIMLGVCGPAHSIPGEL